MNFTLFSRAFTPKTAYGIKSLTYKAKMFPFDKNKKPSTIRNNTEL